MRRLLISLLLDLAGVGRWMRGPVMREVRGIREGQEGRMDTVLGVHRIRFRLLRSPGRDPYP